ncbi:hypothetical protein [Actinopolymorpha alba]|uniref:hypothetical protein n=1 Tax=Actinopolymorpha alba TaxID=533267 RepID=UPI0003780FA8|nr:hypothetical protein [Actinopolymorpha alba]
MTALIPGEVSWTDSRGARTVGGVPSCLITEEDDTVAHAKVEAGYTWLRLPDGGSSPVVGWIRCL